MKTIFKKIGTFFSKTDIFLWLLSIAAVVYSLILINSLQRSTSYSLYNTQLIAVIIGFIVAIIISLIDYKYLLQAWWLFAAVGLILIVLVFLFGHRINGTDDVAWIRVGSISIQPSELIKFIFIITFTKHLQVLVENDKLTNVFGVISLFVHALIPIVLIHFQGEDGTVLVFAFVFLVMMFVGGVQLRYFLFMLIVLVASAPLLWNFVLNDVHKNRILAVFNPEDSSLMEYGWQQYQGKISIASGGMNGFGLGKGDRVSQYIVPEQENDFILSVVGEELGFVGMVLVFVLLLLIMIRIIIIATKARNYSGKMICIGVFSIIATQSIINIGMVLGLLPVIGITLPFFSAGGTSILSILMCIGLVENVYYRKDDIEESKGVLKQKKYKYMSNPNIGY